MIANLLQSSFHAYDCVFRFGGEEFVVLLRSTTLENARKVIDRFRNNVALYYAKSHGRNQSCHYDQLVGEGLLTTVASNDTAEFF